MVRFSWKGVIFASKTNVYMKLNARLTCVLMLLTIIATMQARTPIRQWLVTMPDSVMPLLTNNNRLDFIDFLDSNMDAVVINRLDGRSQMKVLTDDYTAIDYTRSCKVSMKLLPITDSTDVLCMVTTLNAPIEDSRIAFYNSQWQPLCADSLITTPQVSDFAIDSDNEETRSAWLKVEIPFMVYTLSAETRTLECRLSALDYLNSDDRKAIASYVKCETITFTWGDKGFSLQP